MRYLILLWLAMVSIVSAGSYSVHTLIGPECHELMLDPGVLEAELQLDVTEPVKVILNPHHHYHRTITMTSRRLEATATLYSIGASPNRLKICPTGVGSVPTKVVGVVITSTYRFTTESVIVTVLCMAALTFGAFGFVAMRYLMTGREHEYVLLT